jgi:hypothetical protein
VSAAIGAAFCRHKRDICVVCGAGESPQRPFREQRLHPEAATVPQRASDPRKQQEAGNARAQLTNGGGRC